jgi:hypothetical protein
MAEDPHERDRSDSRVPALLGLVLVAVLVAVAYFLVVKLRENSQLQDCVMSGRTNCAPIEAPSTGR